MICKWCGKPVTPGQKKCPACGREVPPLSECGGFYNIVPNWKPRMEEDQTRQQEIAVTECSHTKKQKSTVCWISLIMSIFALIISLTVLIAFVLLLRDIHKTGEDLKRHMDTASTSTTLQSTSDTRDNGLTSSETENPSNTFHP